jgi:hypothetical protein
MAGVRGVGYGACAHRGRCSWSAGTVLRKASKKSGYLSSRCTGLTAKRQREHVRDASIVIVGGASAQEARAGRESTRAIMRVHGRWVGGERSWVGEWRRRETRRVEGPMAIAYSESLRATNHAPQGGPVPR